MASRGRPRRKVVGNTRMDAALDAMRPFGFKSQLVRKTVQELLNVYEGTQGWPFIEEAAYKLLIETILAKQQSSAEDKRNEDSFEDKAITDGVTSTTGIAEVSSSGLVAQEPILQTNDATKGKSFPNLQFLKQGVEDSGVQADRGDRRGVIVKSKNELKPADNVKGSNYSTFVSNVETPLIQSSEACCRRKPCHGWIDSDDDVELIQLPIPPLSKQIEKMIGHSETPSQCGSRRRRKSRWDEKPEGM